MTTNIRRWLLIALTLLLVLVGVPAAQAVPVEQVQPEACSRPEDFREVRNLGPACRMPGGYWRLRLRDGHMVFTHGPDGRAEAEAPEPSPAQLAAPLATQVCVPTTTNHGLLIYAVPSDRTDRYATLADTIRGYFQGAQDRLDTEAQQFGVSAQYKMACDADGRVTVRREVLPTPLNSSNYNTITSDLRARGYTSNLAHYWIYFDGQIIACGQGEFHNDDRPLANNANNTGPRYAISYGCNALMHENGHNMGAVQNSSPNSSGAAHCNDDRDVMCYNDGGPRSGNYRNNVCTDREHYDCNNDDYFNPNPPAGSYLATHWNVAACYNRYIQRSGCGTTPTPTPTTGPTPTPTPGGNPTQVWYLFDSTSGTTAIDSSGSGRNGTLVNGPTWVAGRKANAVNLDGSNDHVTLPAGVVNGLTNFTIATWVRLDTSSAWRRVFDFGTGTTANMFLVPTAGSTIRFAITTSGSGGEQRINGTAALPTGVWKHVAVTKSGNTGTLYVDGVQVGQNTTMTLSPSSLGNTTLNYIGRSQYASDAYLDGQIDEFRIYNRALSAAEVLALFQNP